MMSVKQPMKKIAMLMFLLYSVDDEDCVSFMPYRTEPGSVQWLKPNFTKCKSA